MPEILIIHGPNLSLLGKREPEIYGNFTLDDINGKLEKEALKLNLSLDIMQSDSEGDIVSAIGSASEKYKAVIINPAAYTHTSVAIRDALSALGLPAVEVHLSNIYSREEFRHNSLIAPAVNGQISGFGSYSYIMALYAVANILKNK